MKNRLKLKLLLVLSFIILIKIIIKLPFFLKKNIIFYNSYENNIYNEIKEKLENANCSIMSLKQRLFLNGIVRKFKPKKIVELGVYKGGSSIILLNAIKDIKNSHLYSIDINNGNFIGCCARNLFPELLRKWSLFSGNIAIKFLEEIGGGIDLAFIDTSHFEPGEILDFLMILPFLKQKALVIFHDISQQIITLNDKVNNRNEWAPYIIFNLIRGKKYFPSGNTILTHDIGLVQLDRNQINYVHDYFRALGGQWQYFLKEKHIELLRAFIKKYYDSECSLIFEETIKFNRKFVKKYPIENYYSLKKNYRKIFKNILIHFFKGF